MILTKIPHFREVMVCSFECPHCGNRWSTPNTRSLQPSDDMAPHTVVVPKTESFIFARTAQLSCKALDHDTLSCRFSHLEVRSDMDAFI
jgi:hypothetical protein